MQLLRADLRVRRQKGDPFLEYSSPFQTGSNTASLEWENTTGFIEYLNLPDGSQIAHIDFHLQQTTCNHNNNLALEKPISVTLHVAEQPEAITALYLFEDWWTRPAFVSSWEDVPERTQVALLKYRDRYACLVPMVGTEFKSVLAPGIPNGFTLELQAGRPGQSSVFEPLFYYTEAGTVQAAIDKAFTWLADEKNIPLRAARPLPEMFEYLGWCSWDACYKDLTEEVVRSKAAEFREKHIPVRWILMDDGWETVQDDTLVDFIPDPKKFPDGFADMVRELKSDGKVDWFGVWHGIAGYWAGVDPDGYLARTQKENLLPAVNGKLLPGPDPDQAYRFFHAWHEYLRQEGIDFVKVDVQGSIPNYYENSASLCRAARGLAQGLDAGTVCMNTAVINCMGMPMENILARPASAVSRNSNDFFPAKPDSFREHLLENAYNALYHGAVYVCDWDMFWTHHPDAARHALLRAISGGPVYFSDPVGRTDPAVLQPLAYLDGRLLRMSGPARVTEDCIFSDPFKTGVLKVANAAPYGSTTGGGIAAYNLTEAAQSCTLRPGDIPGLAACEQYLAYDWFRQQAQIVPADGSIELDLESGAFSWVQFLPYDGAAGFLGLTDKYAGFLAVESQCPLAGGLIGTLHEQGPVGIVSSRRLERITSNGVDSTSQIEQTQMDSSGLTLYTLTLPVAAGQTVIEVEWR